jgi:hypothetical protein
MHAHYCYASKIYTFTLIVRNNTITGTNFDPKNDFLDLNDHLYQSKLVLFKSTLAFNLHLDRFQFL